MSNTPHFANPNGNVNSSNFGKVLATQTAYAMGRSREFQFGLRLGARANGRVQRRAAPGCPAQRCRVYSLSYTTTAETG